MFIKKACLVGIFLVLTVARRFVDCQSLTVQVYCDDPGYGVNAVRTPQFSGAVTAGATVTYQCVTPGYDLFSGNLTLTCLDTGIWSGTVPNCQLVDCGDPGVALFGNRTMTTTTYQSLATYTCASEMYEFEPPASLTHDEADIYVKTTKSITIQCGSDKKWNPTLPTFRRKVCGSPPTVTGAISIPSGTQVGDFAIYAALPGYRLSRQSILTCTDNRTWEPTGNPIVTPVACRVPPLSNNARWSAATSDVFSSSCHFMRPYEILCPYNGTALVQECVTGYEYGSGTIERSCQEDGSWNGSPLICQQAHCAPIEKTNPTLIVNEQANYVGAVATYSCALGYKSAPSSIMSRLCKEDGIWSGSEPVCTPIECVNATFKPVVNSTARHIFSKDANDFKTIYSYYDDDYSNDDEIVITISGATYGHHVEFQCENGTKWARGSRVWTCQNDGNWDTTDPIVCKYYIAPPGINALPPTDARLEAENADSIGRSIFIALCVLFAAICLVDLPNMIRAFLSRLRILSNLNNLNTKQCHNNMPTV